MTINSLPLFTLLAVSALTGHPASSAASVEEDRGLAIAREMQRRDSGWADQTADMVMILRNRQGQESRREIRVRSLEVDGDGDKTLTIFDLPRDVKGTAFLSFSHALAPDEQWLYLPALKRVKRISSANKSGPFMGSEFAYEDLTSQEVDKYSYRWLRDEMLDGNEVMVVERIPRYEHSGYTRQVIWVSASKWQALKLEFYDRKNALLKTLVADDYRQYGGRFWRAHRMNMVNHQSGKSTRLEWSNFGFENELSSADFDKNALKRVR